MARKNRLPFAATASVSLSYVSASFAGVKSDFDAAQLINSFRVPIEVYALRVMLEPIPSQAVTDLVLSPFVNLEIKLGKHYLTDGPVPVAIMAPYRVWEVNLEDFPTANDFTQLSMRTIILPKPIYLRPGVGFGVQGSIPADVLTSSTNVFNSNFQANVHFTVLGKFVSPGERIPDVHHLPMISHVQLTRAEKPISLETDLRNPLSKTLHVCRMIGAKVVSHTPGNEVMNEEFTNFSSAAEGQFHLRFPDGEALSENLIEFSHVFGQMRAWPAEFDLEANERIVARLGARGAGPSVRGMQIGIFGTRPEVIQ